MAEVVLDASALLALVHKEPGWQTVLRLLPGAVVSAVNWCETLQRLHKGGMPAETAQLVLKQLLGSPVAFDVVQSAAAVSIHERTRQRGLSFGDCACLALALIRKVPAVTAEKFWTDLDLGITIEPIG